MCVSQHVELQLICFIAEIGHSTRCLVVVVPLHKPGVCFSECLCVLYCTQQYMRHPVN